MKITKINTFIGALLLMVIAFISCKDKKKEDPQPQPPQIVEVVHRKEVILRNQYTVDPEVWFYKIHEDAYSANKDANFDLAFIYYNPESNEKYLIGSPSHNKIKKEFNTTSTYKTKFYNFPNSNFTSSSFDTLKYASALSDIIKKGEKIYDGFGEASGLPSDAFGWSPGYVFGIETEKGKYGVVRVKTAPTGNLNIPGFVTLEIKIQP